MPNLIKKTGFTIIELIVAIGIMVFILAVILANYKKFDSGIVMTNLAYDMALSIRTAQTYGVSVKGSEGAFSRWYGISFKSGDSSWEKKYTLFTDNNTNLFYDYSSLDLAVNTFNLRGAYYIKRLCYLAPSESCLTGPGQHQVDIIFKRPNPDANLTIEKGVGSISASGVKIIIGSKQDATAEKTITVRTTGQISVE